MAFAEYQAPATLGQLNSSSDDASSNFMSLMQRAQQVAQSKAQFPLLQQQLAGQIAINAQSQESNNLAIQRQLAQASLIPSDLAAQKAKNDADIATSATVISTQHANALLAQQAAADFPNVMGALNSLTGSGPSTAPESIPGQTDDESGDPSDPVAAARAAQGLPPAPGATPATPATPPAINYASVTNATNAYNVFKARYGQIPALAPMLGQLDAKLQSLQGAYQGQLISQMPGYHSAILSASTTAGTQSNAAAMQKLSSLAADPDFAHAAALSPGLKDEYDKAYETISKGVTQDKQIAAEAANNNLRLKQEKDQHTADVQRQTNIDVGTGYTGNARSEAAATQFSSDAADYNNVAPKLKELLAIADQGAGAKFDLATKARASVLATELQGNLKGSIVGGKLTDTDIGFLRNLIKDPTNLTSIPSATKAALQQALSDAGSDLDRKAAAQGLKKVPAANKPAASAF